MVAATTYAALSEIAQIFIDLFGADNVDLPNKRYEPPTDATTEWARVVIQHTDGGQGSLAMVDGKRRWERIGVCTIELYTQIGVGLSRAYELAESVVNAYQGKRTPSDVWFRDVVHAERGEVSTNIQQSVTRYRIDVTMTFTYDVIN